MRDPKRIDNILEEIKKVWTEVPDQRFLQLIYNIVREAKIYSDTFYLEDEEFLKIVQKFMKRNEIDRKVDEVEKHKESILKTNKNIKRKKKRNEANN